MTSSRGTRFMATDAAFARHGPHKPPKSAPGPRTARQVDPGRMHSALVDRPIPAAVLACVPPPFTPTIRCPGN